MRLINLLAVILFAILAILAGIVAIIHRCPRLLILSGTFIFVAYVAYQDFINPE